ncbi:hypothetical protein [Pseudalkalibacillus decolorationis]|uniref:hypothetical protein n=1 Tax=Pseudalkalibacillus decolorationis TaxID=163879 RepID=UPI0027E2979D|nr:hypothetical protein [Pseudalkalibacillus decolorationis]
MPQYYDNEEFDFESNAETSDADRPYGCYPDYKPCPPPPPPRPPGGQLAGAQTAPAGNLLYCLPVGGNGQVAGVQSPTAVAGAQSPYNISPYGGAGGAPFYPPYPMYGGYGGGGGWVWAVVVILFILLLISGAYFWFCRYR